MWKIVFISLGVGSAQSGADNFASYTKPKNETNLSHSKTLVEIETELKSFLVESFGKYISQSTGFQQSTKIDTRFYVKIEDFASMSEDLLSSINSFCYKRAISLTESLNGRLGENFVLKLFPC